MKRLTVKIARNSGMTTYKVPCTPSMKVLDVVLRIQETLEPDLAFRWNCGEGICGSCAAEVNGKPVLMCKAPLHGEMLTIAPLKVFPVIKDLVTDPSEVYAKLSRLKPYSSLKKGKGFHTIFDEQVRDVQNMRKCIDCFICYDSCHVIRNHKDLPFPGPLQILKAVSFDRHPGEKKERVSLLDKEGLWNCNMSRCCSESCPQGIKVSEDAITWAKEHSISLRKKPASERRSL